MLPPPEVAANIVSNERPPSHPKGPNTNFQYPTPMPYRYTEGSLSEHNARLEGAKQEHPIYATTTSEFGKIAIQETDFPMRWYGLEGGFTSSWVAPPKTKVNTGLNTAMERSDIHTVFDQGWSGNLGLKDFNVSNHTAAKHYGKPPRSVKLGHN